MKKVYEEILSQIKESKKVAIYIHNLMDADCIGSAAALKLGLERLGKEADIFSEDKSVPKKYLCIPCANEINKPKLKDYDLAISVDVASIQKLGRGSSTQFLKFEKSIKIDHHISSDNFAKLNFVEHYSSCSMIIYYLLPLLGVEEIDKDMATAIYAGMSGDTGCFRNANTKPMDHKLAAKLMEMGVDSYNIDKWLFKYASMHELELKRRALGRFKKYVNNKMSIIYLLQKDFDETHAKLEDTASIIYLVDVVDDCELAVVICEHQPGKFKVSFRSVTTDAALSVAKAFGGGGHAQSSGCQIYGCLNTVINKIVKESKFILDEQK